MPAALGPGPLVRRRRQFLTGPTRGYLFVAPVLVYLALTALYPLASVVAMSFQDVAEGQWRFAGGLQYARALRDGLVWNSLRNTAVFTWLRRCSTWRSGSAWPWPSTSPGSAGRSGTSSAAC